MPGKSKKSKPEKSSSNTKSIAQIVIVDTCWALLLFLLLTLVVYFV